MVNKEKIINQVTTIVDSIVGFELRWRIISLITEGSFNYGDGSLEIVISNTKVLHFTVLIRHELREYQLSEVLRLTAEKNSQFIIIAENISSELKKKLRDWKIGYIDTAGNMFITTPEIYVWVDGQKVIEDSASRYNRAFTKTGLKLIFYLLVNKNAINLPYRTLSEVVKISTGNITNIMNGLIDAGFLLPVDSRQYVLQRKKILLTRWISGYAESLRPSLLLKRYRTRVDHWKDLPTSKGKDFWGGEPAAELITNYIKPQEMILYTDESKIGEYENLKLAFGNNSGNLILFKKFWNDPILDTEWYVPPLLVYADLVLTDDPRCIEVAEMIYKQYLKDEFDEPERRKVETIN